MNNDSQITLLSFSLAYFVSDTIFGVLKKYNDGKMNLHHCIVIASLAYVIFKGMYADNYYWAMMVTEISNPFMLTSKILEQHRGYERVSKILMIIFCATFVFFRCYVVCFFLNPMLRSPVVLFLKLQSAIVRFIKRSCFVGMVLDNL